MGKPGHTGISRLLHATRFSLRGIAFAWRHERAFRQELMLTAALMPVALWLGRGPQERLLLIGSCLLVLIVELLNSAVEAAVDRVGHEHHELSGRAKDMGSAAVMLSLLLLAACWATVIYERFLA